MTTHTAHPTGQARGLAQLAWREALKRRNVYIYQGHALGFVPWHVLCLPLRILPPGSFAPASFRGTATATALCGYLPLAVWPDAAAEEPPRWHAVRGASLANMLDHAFPSTTAASAAAASSVQPQNLCHYCYAALWEMVVAAAAAAEDTAAQAQAQAQAAAAIVPLEVV